MRRQVHPVADPETEIGEASDEQVVEAAAATEALRIRFGEQ